MPTVFIPAPFFPPSAMPPSQRVRLLVRHLQESGWKPVIFTVDQRYREDEPDPWMTEIAGHSFEKIEVRVWDQRRTRKFGVGDLGLRMFFGLYRAMLKQVKKEKPDLILYPVPPWYIMVMAPWIKRITGIPYAIDYIDPWVVQTGQRNAKALISQHIAGMLEGPVVRKSSAIFAVSQGILDDLKKKYPSISNIPLVAVPYGVEVSDYAAIPVQDKTGPEIIVRYTGAISDNMLVVMDSLLRAFKEVRKFLPVRIIFTGTSYAGKGLAKPVLGNLISKYQAEDFVTENPARVGYRQALEINKGADLLLLVGDTTPYYAASKMMGLVASGKPFFGWVHADSFPAKFLAALKFPDCLFFQTGELGDERKIRQLTEALLKCIINREHFIPVQIGNTEFQKYTAHAMTKIFVETFGRICI